jgi:hypothetical protein
MIVVRVELHSARTGRVRELARMVIDNIGGTAATGDYRCRTLRGRTRSDLDAAWRSRKFTREGGVTGHKRLALHVWHLVAKALSNMRYGEG